MPVKHEPHRCDVFWWCLLVVFAGEVWQGLVLWFRPLATDFFVNSDKEVSKKTPPQARSLLF